MLVTREQSHFYEMNSSVLAYLGFGLAIDPLYISEISPAAHRGRLVTWSEIALNVGIVLGFFSGILFYNLDDNVEWRVMFAMGCILPIIMIILVQTVMPESPRFLVDKGQIAEAKEILIKLYPEGKKKQNEEMALYHLKTNGKTYCYSIFY